MDEISRMEKILRGDPIEPITRLEIFCAMAAGTWSGDPLTPASRLEYFLSQISGGGGGVTLSTLLAYADDYSGTQHISFPGEQEYAALEGYAYDKVWISDEYCTKMGQSRKYFYNPSASSNLPQYYYTWRVNYESMYLAVSGSISANSFYHCEALKNLVLPNNGVVSLANVNAFSNTPFASNGSGGTLWAPSSLIASYQAASNWVTILGYANNSIQAIEGSIYE